jgi:dihydroorotase
MFDVPILNHPEELHLTHNGIMHEGLTSMVLGLAGIPSDAEDVMTARDLRLAEYTGGRLHLMNISTAGSVDLLRRFKSRGLKVTAEVCPAHFSLTDDTLRTFDANCKVNPPLRSRNHVEACIAGLADDTIDVIASCHAPRASEKKLQELDRAPFGMVNLETTLGLVGKYLIEPNHLSWPQAIAKMTLNPARALGLSKGTLQVGAEADITIFDPQERWTVRAAEFESLSRNTPFDGTELIGRATCVLVDGEVRFSRE